MGSGLTKDVSSQEISDFIGQIDPSLNEVQKIILENNINALLLYHYKDNPKGFQEFLNQFHIPLEHQRILRKAFQAVTFNRRESILRKSIILPEFLMAEEGNGYAQKALAYWFERKSDMRPIIEERLKNYQKLIEQVTAQPESDGNENSDDFLSNTENNQGKGYYCLGWCYEYGIGVPSDISKAYECYRLASEKGSTIALVAIGLCYIEGKGVDRDSVEAVTWLRSAIQAGNSFGMVSLGCCYDQGIGVEKDSKEALKWYRMASELGNSCAMNNLGLCYQHGEGTEADSFEAAKWFKEAAQTGNTGALLNLALCYERGEGINYDPEEAVRLYSLAAEKGNTSAMYYLGLCYLKGSGTIQDKDLSINWLIKAKELGDVDAMNVLGHYCEERNELDQAISYYRQAAEFGNQYAKNKLKHLSVFEQSPVLDFPK